MKQFFYLFLFMSTIVNAQESTSNPAPGKVTSAVNWSKGLSWEQIKSKAKKENKFILVDCYASWCGPCKMMDKEVFVNDSVGNALKDKFIAVEVQMDTSNSDNESVKDWYGDAHFIQQEYDIDAYPTFLFFSPEGKIIHKTSGYMGVKKFINLTEDALNPDKQYYTLLNKFQNGVLDNKSLLYLGDLANSSNDIELARQIAMKYINDYLMKLGTEKIFTMESLSYITHYVNSSKEKSFSLIFENSARVNKIVERPGFAENWIHYVIYNEDIYPKLYVKGQGVSSVDWKKLSDDLNHKYGPYYASRLTLDAKARWYASQKNWSGFTKNTVAFVERYGKDFGEYDLATNAWSVFLFSENKDELNTAIKWTKRVMDKSKDSSNTIPAVMDTYANLVYKLDYLFNNKKSSFKAIAIENKALDLANKYHVENFQKEFADTVEKMKSGKRTWKRSSTSD